MNNKAITAYPYQPNVIDKPTGLVYPFDHSPDFLHITRYSANMGMSGSRATDRSALLAFYNILSAPGYHCHHTFSYTYDAITRKAKADMQLVSAYDHMLTYPHPGAVRQWNYSGNHDHCYRSVMENKEAVTSYIKYSSEELDKFGIAHKTRIPDELTGAYLNQAPVKTEFRKKDGNEIFSISELLMLYECVEYKDVLHIDYVIDILKKNKISVYTTENNDNLIPYATDECGNVFYYSFDDKNDIHYWFYDHECDEHFEVE